ncbi:MAG: hypothetical protein JO077_00795 [Verrucomicrobia bacterium]|nr:hypothetical protein [Verrucomicrobiota bacterium]
MADRRSKLSSLLGYGGSLRPFLSRRRFAPLFLLHNKQPDRPHQMLGGNINLPFPENLRDPVNADAAVVGFQDLVFAFSQRLDLGRFAEAAAFRAARDLDRISGSRFEKIRIGISQDESPRVFRVYDKEMAN